MIPCGSAVGAAERLCWAVRHCKRRQTVERRFATVAASNPANQVRLACSPLESTTPIQRVEQRNRARGLPRGQ
jgi:hypothetical protein